MSLKSVSSHQSLGAGNIASVRGGSPEQVDPGQRSRSSLDGLAAQETRAASGTGKDASVVRTPVVTTILVGSPGDSSATTTLASLRRITFAVPQGPVAGCLDSDETGAAVISDGDRPGSGATLFAAHREKIASIRDYLSGSERHYEAESKLLLAGDLTAVDETGKWLVHVAIDAKEWHVVHFLLGKMSREEITRKDAPGSKAVVQLIFGETNAAEIPEEVKDVAVKGLVAADAALLLGQDVLRVAIKVGNYDLLQGFVDARDSASLSEALPHVRRTLLHILIADISTPVPLLTALIGKVTVKSLLTEERVGSHFSANSFFFARKWPELSQTAIDRVFPRLGEAPDSERKSRISTWFGLNLSSLHTDQRYAVTVKKQGVTVHRAIDPSFSANQTVESIYRELHNVFGPTRTLTDWHNAADISVYEMKNS